MLRQLLVLVGAALLPAGAPAHAHPPAGPAGALVGTVVDAASRQPLASASVHVRPLDGTGPARAVRTVITDTAGRYRVESLPGGDYELRAELMGYRSGILVVRVADDALAQLSVGLEVNPIAMEPILVTSRPPGGFGGGRAGAGARDSARVGAEQVRRSGFLSPDAVLVTRADVDEAVSLGETDVLRALQRRSGVGTRDDYSAELWTRGASWDLTSVQFDGVPVFNPMHAVGAFSVITTESLSQAAFHPGLQPISGVAGAAGLLDLRSRSGLDAPRPEHSAELSVVSVRASTAGRTPVGDVGWLLAGRRTHLDVVAGVPYAFVDLTGRVDVRVGRGGVLEASGIVTDDALTARIADLVEIDDARWGHRLGRLSLELPLWGGRVRTTGGFSGYASRSSAHPSPPSVKCTCQEDPEAPYVAPTMRSAVGYGFVETAWTAVRGTAQRTSAGVRVSSHASRFFTTGAWPYRPAAAGAYGYAHRHRHASAWGEHRWRVLPRVELEAGLRVDGPLSASGFHDLLWGPRLAGRVTLADGLTATAGWARTRQYTYSVHPDGPGLDGVALSHTLWIVAGDSTAPVRADLATVGMEYGAAHGWVVSGHAFARGIDGLAVAHAGPGTLDARQPFRPGVQRAHGAELSVRRVAGAWTGGLAYSVLRAENRAGGSRYAAPNERGRVAHGSLMARLPLGLRAGVSGSYAAGEPLTRYVARLTCTQSRCERVSPIASRAAVARAAPYRSVDLSASWSRPVGGARLDVQLQLRNVLRHDNRAAYRETRVSCPTPRGCELDLTGRSASLRLTDLTLPGLPFLPLLAVRLTF